MMSQMQQTDTAAQAPAEDDQTHPSEVVAAHEQALDRSGFNSRFVEATPGERVHVIEGGAGAPLVMLHGSGPSALLFLPLLERLTGVRAIAVDRPGFGLSDPHTWPTTSRREAAVEWVGSLLDGLDLREAALLGSSAGGTWAVWFALAHPDRVSRLILLGAPPTLNVNTPPPPLRGMASIDPANPPPMPPPSRETVIQSMSGMGEGDTIVNYPQQIEALVAAGRDAIASMANLDELQALISSEGWQPSVETRVGELEELKPSTLLVWGTNDPLGGTDAARQAASAIPDAQLEMLDSGHGPWLGHPDQVANLVSTFITGHRT
jgi:pimeloyl-ACP methyl ester carboxylesterase